MTPSCTTAIQQHTHMRALCAALQKAINVYYIYITTHSHAAHNIFPLHCIQHSTQAGRIRLTRTPRPIQKRRGGWVGVGGRKRSYIDEPDYVARKKKKSII
jgi:hypothetical protein